MFDEFAQNNKKSQNKKKESAVIKEKNIFDLTGMENKAVKKIGADSKKKLVAPHPTISKLNKRIEELEKKGKKRGKRNMLIGFILGSLIALVVMILIYVWTQEVCNITTQTDEDIVNIEKMNHRMK